MGIGGDREMKLGDLNTVVEMFADDFVFSCAFDDVMSYRGYYDEVSFAPARGVTAAKVKDLVAKAFSETFEGYKGCKYTYNSDTDCYLAHYGNCGEHDFERFEELIRDMIEEYEK